MTHKNYCKKMAEKKPKKKRSTESAASSDISKTRVLVRPGECARHRCIRWAPLPENKRKKCTCGQVQTRNTQGREFDSDVAALGGQTDVRHMFARVEARTPTSSALPSTPTRRTPDKCVRGQPTQGCTCGICLVLPSPHTPRNVGGASMSGRTPTENAPAPQPVGKAPHQHHSTAHTSPDQLRFHPDHLSCPAGFTGR